MSIGLPVALALLAEGVAYGPAPPPAPKPPAKAAPRESCEAQQANASTREIVICAQRSSGYRLNPDVMEAKREARQALAGRLKTPAEKASVDNSSVGPMAGYGARSIDLLAMAIGAATMAKRLAEGKEIGSMFVTRPQPDEYHRYLEAKQRREAREAAERAAAIVAAAKAEQAKSSNAAAPARP